MDIFVEVLAIVGAFTVLKWVAVRSGWTCQVATYRLTAKVERRLQWLQLSLNCTQTELFRRALAIFDNLFKAMARDAEIIIRESDGTEELLQTVPRS